MMARGDERKNWMREGDVRAEHQIRLLKESLEAHIDLDHHGRVEKAAFLKNWNKVAKTAFKQSLCVIL